MVHTDKTVRDDKPQSQMGDRDRLIARFNELRKDTTNGLWDLEPMMRLVHEEVGRERDSSTTISSSKRFRLFLLGVITGLAFSAISIAGYMASVEVYFNFFKNDDFHYNADADLWHIKHQWELNRIAYNAAKIIRSGGSVVVNLRIDCDLEKALQFDEIDKVARFPEATTFLGGDFFACTEPAPATQKPDTTG